MKSHPRRRNVACVMRHVRAGAATVAAGVGAAMIAATGLSAQAGAEEAGVALTFESCKTAQIEQITQAVALASLKLDAAVAQMDAAGQTSVVNAAIQIWFGKVRSVSRLHDNFRLMRDRLSDAAHPIRLACELTNDGFAYTYAGMTGEGFIAFGVEFFRTQPECGIDSRWGTVVHELAHMTPGVEADDHAYPLEEVRALARLDPETAADNAQNYEYFLEAWLACKTRPPLTS